MAWVVYFDKMWRVKGHLVDEANAELLVTDLNHRFDAEKDNERCRVDEQVYFEPGGHRMYHLKQPKTVFEVRGKKLELDCAKVFDALSELTLAERQHFEGAEKRWQKAKARYEKINGRPFPIVRSQDLKQDKPGN